MRSESQSSGLIAPPPLQQRLYKQHRVSSTKDEVNGQKCSEVSLTSESKICFLPPSSCLVLG